MPTIIPQTGEPARQGRRAPPESLTASATTEAAARKRAPRGGERERAVAPSASRRKTILVAVTGLSPAVLTETVWALAQETPPIIPDQVIVHTTKTGQATIASQLFGADDIWRQLRASLLGSKHASDPRLDFDQTPDRVKIVHVRTGGRRVPLDKLTTLADNQGFADALVDELWTHTSKPDTRVIASLAGGFKTMSALLLSAMQLLANPGDRVTHVLVAGGYDATEPGFFFPEQRTQDLVTRGQERKPLKAAKAKPLITLIELPVIPLRRWFEEALATKPPSYAELLTKSVRALEETVGDVTLTLGPVALPDGEKKHHILINGQRHELSPDRFAYLRFFAGQLKAGQTPFANGTDCVEELDSWLKEQAKLEPRLAPMAQRVAGTKSQVVEEKKEPFTAADLSRRLNELRNFLRDLVGGGRNLAAALPKDGDWSLRLKPGNVTLR